MKAVRLVAALIFIFASISVFAQTANLNPPKEITDLSWCLGEWSGSMHWTMQGTPAMDVATTLKVDMDGQFLREMFSQDMSGTAITETSYLGWNEKDKRYDRWIFTNYAPNPRIEHGTINGDVRVMESEPWNVMGQTTAGRFTVTKVSNTEMKMMLEFKANDKWAKVSEGTFKKTA